MLMGSGIAIVSSAVYKSPQGRLAAGAIFVSQAAQAPGSVQRSGRSNDPFPTILVERALGDNGKTVPFQPELRLESHPRAKAVDLLSGLVLPPHQLPLPAQPVDDMLLRPAANECGDSIRLRGKVYHKEAGGVGAVHLFLKYGRRATKPHRAIRSATRTLPGLPHLLPCIAAGVKPDANRVAVYRL
jgi:hypothetical protein